MESQTEKKRLDPRRAARLGAKPIRAAKEFEFGYEELGEEVASALGLAPGETGVVEFEFFYKPWGFAAGGRWAERARKTSKTPQVDSFYLGLNDIVVRSNFGLEDHNYDELRGDVFHWVITASGLREERADPKESGGSSVVELFKELTKEEISKIQALLGISSPTS